MNIIREVANPDFDTYFDYDGFRCESDICHTMFILTNWWNYRGYRGLNADLYEEVVSDADRIIDGFSCVENDCVDYTERYTYREVIEDVMPYSDELFEKLHEWYMSCGDLDQTDYVAKYLSIVTGKEWVSKEVCGYCQGDHCHVVCCTEAYPNPEFVGQIWLGCAKEFSIKFDGEDDEVYGYIYADGQAATDEEYKSLICADAGLDPANTRLEMIDNTYTTTHYEYRAI